MLLTKNQGSSPSAALLSLGGSNLAPAQGLCQPSPCPLLTNPKTTLNIYKGFWHQICSFQHSLKLLKLTVWVLHTKGVQLLFSLVQWLHPRPCHHLELNPLKIISFTSHSMSEVSSSAPLLAPQVHWDSQLLHVFLLSRSSAPTSPYTELLFLPMLLTLSSYSLINTHNSLLA